MQGTPGFVQIPCSKCGTTVWVSPAAGVGYCPSCHNPTQLPTGLGGPPGGGFAPGAGFGAPGAPFQGGAYHAPPALNAMGAKFRVIGGVVGAMVLAGAGAGVAVLKPSAKGKNAASYSDVGLDAKKPDADQMISSVAGLATKWKKDASWWGVNFLSVNADGVVDVSKGATVEYVSLSSAKSLASTTNKDSIKEFSFGPSAINYNRMTGVRDAKQWQDAKPLPTPRCTIKQLVQSLKAKGLTGTKTVRVTYDAQFGFAAPAEPSWRVIGDDPKMDSYFSMATCAPTK